MRRDRHGRTARVDNDRRRRPTEGYRVVDARRFRTLVADAIEQLPPPLADPARAAGVEIAEVPEGDDLERAAAHERVPLGRFVPAAGGRRARLVLYRRPLEARALNRGELVDVLRAVIGDEVAVALGLEHELDDDWDDE